MADGNFKVGILVAFVSLLLEPFYWTQAGLSFLFHSLPFGLDLGHHLPDIWVPCIQTASKFERLHGSSNISVLHLFISLAAIRSNLLTALQFRDFFLHSLEIGIVGLDSKSVFQSLDTVRQVIEGLLSHSQTKVSLDKVLVGKDALASSLCHFFVL